MLSSSLEFVYTDAWVPVYSIQRKSSNNVIVDEVDILDGEEVLFNLNNAKNTVRSNISTQLWSCQHVTSGQADLIESGLSQVK